MPATATLRTRSRVALILACATALPLVSACEAVALTAFGVGASTGVSHTLNGIAYRTFTAPTPRVRGAALAALNKMGIKPGPATKNDPTIRAKANDRDIEIEFDALSANTTRMRTIAKQGVFYDSATAVEIIIQTEKLLGNA